MSQTSFIFASIIVAWVIFATMKGNLGKWLDIIGV